MPYGFSPKLPLTYDKHDGPYRLTKTIKEMGTQNLKMLVLTNPGERIMNPDFGVGVSRYLFEQSGNFNRQGFESRLFSQTKKYLPYINITNLEIVDNNNNIIGLSITFFIESFMTEEKLFINLEENTLI
tara:strand:+ start:442 stop:828 length:387 start_codon:yes stop_codon:yes gene_type:complete